MENTSISPTPDHDTLIRLDGKFDIFTRQIINDVKELKEGTQARLANIEARITLQEKIHDEVQPINSFKTLNAISLRMSNYESNLKFLLVLSSTIGGIITFTLTLIAFFFKLIP